MVVYKVEGSASVARVTQGQQREAGMQPAVVQKGCQQGSMRVVELEETAEEMAMMEPTTPDCRSWQWSLHTQ